MAVELARIPIIEKLTFNQLLSEAAAEAEDNPAPPPAFVPTIIIKDPLIKGEVSLVDEEDTYGLDSSNLETETSRPLVQAIRRAVDYATSLLP